VFEKALNMLNENYVNIENNEKFPKDVLGVYWQS
jgi:hypothetical protein